MISNFGLFLTDIPEETDGVIDYIQKGPEVEYIDPMNLRSGIKYTYYRGGIQTAALIESSASVKLTKTGSLQKICIIPAEAPIGYSFSFEGFIKIQIGGSYTFKLKSANGSVLLIGGKRYIDNDEPHDIKTVEKKLELNSGYYSIKVLYTSFRHNGMLEVSWSGPGFEMKEIDGDYLFHRCKNEEI
jgi:hypothetical protein